MRKITSFLFALLIATPAFALSDVTFDNTFRLRGDGARQGSGVRVLKLVRFSDADDNDASIASGDAVVYDLVSDDSVTIVRTTTSGDMAFAGIAAMTIQSSDADTGDSAYDDAGRRNWGWIVVHGMANANVTAGGTNSNVAGEFFITSTDAGTITALTAATASVPVTRNGLIRAVGGAGGFFFDAADTTSTVVEVMVETV